MLAVLLLLLRCECVAGVDVVSKFAAVGVWRWWVGLVASKSYDSVDVDVGARTGARTHVDNCVVSCTTITTTTVGDS